MTKNIEQRTEIAVSKYEKASDIVDKLSGTDSVINTPAGPRSSFPKLSREFASDNVRREFEHQTAQSTREQQFQERFSASQQVLSWQSGVDIADQFQRYSIGTEGQSDYKEYLPNPDKLPFTTGSTINDDLVLELWLENGVPSKSYTDKYDALLATQATSFNIHPPRVGDNARAQDQVKAFTNALTLQGTLYPLSEVVAGEITDINLVAKPYTATVGGKTVYLFNIKHYSREHVNIGMFWAAGDGRLDNGKENPTPTDDTVVIQEALKYAVIKGRSKVTAVSNCCYKTTSKIYIPTTYRAPSNVTELPGEGKLVIDFQGAEFVGLGYDNTDNILFEAGYFDENGDIRSVIGQPPEKYLTAGYTLQNFSCRNFYLAMRLRNWVYGCEVRNVFGVDVAQMLNTERCFYTNFEKIVHRGAYLDGVPIFHFKDNNNIMPLKSLVSGNCDIGYQFDGAVEALRMVDCGIEGFKTYGVITNGDYNITFSSCYFESGQGIGHTGKGTNHVTFDNCWGYGNIQMVGDYSDNTNVRIRNNNNLGGGARWFDSLPDYCISDFDLPNVIHPSGKAIEKYNAPVASNVDQDITIYDPNSGLKSVEGRVEQTNGYHTQRVNGKMTNGFRSERKAIGHVISQEALSNGSQRVIYDTGIEWSDTQCIYLALRVAHLLGTWTWYGHVYGDEVVKAVGSTGDPIVVNNAGKVRIISPSLASGGNLGPYAGEIRLV